LCTQLTPPAASALSVLEKVHSVDPAIRSVLDIEPAGVSRYTTYSLIWEI
jgi:hypothetical protein